MHVWDLSTTPTLLVEELQEDIILGQSWLHEEDANNKESKKRLNVSTAGPALLDELSHRVPLKYVTLFQSVLNQHTNDLLRRNTITWHETPTVLD
ncbi:hypothetical protein PR048_011012 [Dryococelus australis]|uniref:Uncharacterized protein n=1 Tax=Dryococelus australis TaxID=614101 RepID=A0ABQ9HKF8_9NEOP|nr:hypothetical protein PR048_011012 [Dryococelus australis]